MKHRVIDERTPSRVESQKSSGGYGGPHPFQPQHPPPHPPKKRPKLASSLVSFSTSISTASLSLTMIPDFLYGILLPRYCLQAHPPPPSSSPPPNSPPHRPPRQNRQTRHESSAYRLPDRTLPEDCAECGEDGKTVVLGIAAAVQTTVVTIVIVSTAGRQHDFIHSWSRTKMRFLKIRSTRGNSVSTAPIMHPLAAIFFLCRRSHQQKMSTS